MKNKAYVPIAILLLMASPVALVVVGGTAHAQALTIKAHKTDYGAGDTITLSGTVGIVQAGQERQPVVVLQISNPINAVYRPTQVPVAADGSWSYQFKIGGMMGIRGEYRAVAIYSDGQQAETTFNFTAKEAPSPTTMAEEMQTFEVEISSQQYDIRYMVEGGEVTGMTADLDFATLTVTIDQTENGTLTIELPRVILDAKSDGGEDAGYTIVIDDREEGAVVFEEETGNDTRTLIISLPAGTETVEVTGTTMVPEFRMVAAIVLAMAIFGAIAVTRRFPCR